MIQGFACRSPSANFSTFWGGHQERQGWTCPGAADGSLSGSDVDMSRIQKCKVGLGISMRWMRLSLGSDVEWSEPQDTKVGARANPKARSDLRDQPYICSHDLGRSKGKIRPATYLPSYGDTRISEHHGIHGILEPVS